MMGRTFVTGLLLAIGCGATAAMQVGGIEVEVGSTTIRSLDVDAGLDAARRQALVSGRLEAFAADARAAVRDELVQRRLLALAARDAGVDKRQEVQRRIDAAVEAILAEAMTRDHAAAADDDTALRAHYDSHPIAFRSPGRVRAKHLVVKTQAEAERLRKQLVTGADFGELAKTHNIDNSRSTAGDLGWLRPGVMVREFETVVFALRAGETSAVVRTAYGFHIIHATQAEPGTLPPFEQIRDAVRQHYIDARMGQLTDRLRQRYPVKLHEAPSHRHGK